MDANEKDLVVRRVMPVDLRATAELLVAENRHRGLSSDVDQVRNTVQAALEDAHRVLVIGAYHENQPGFAHGKMVGALVMNVVVSVANAGEAGWIETLFVRPDYRRRGLAERMLQQALSFCETRGLRALEIEMGHGQDLGAAQPLYQKYHFHSAQSSRLTRRFGSNS